MANKGPFPPKDADFNDYIVAAIPYLNTNSARLVVSAGNITAILALKTTWDTLYPQSQNTNTKTKTITDDKNILRDDIEDLLRDIYNDIPKSVLTSADRNTLNLKERGPATARQPIDTAPTVGIRAKEGRRIQVECRVESDSTRPSRHEDCDLIECRYIIESNKPQPTNPGEPTPPLPQNTVPTVITSTKARFIIEFGEDDAGKSITLQARWKNTVEVNKSGPWSNPTTTIITL